MNSRATDAITKAQVRDLVARTRSSQGLPGTIQDPTALAKLAALAETPKGRARTSPSDFQKIPRENPARATAKTYP